MAKKKTVFVANSVTTLRHAVCAWIIQHAEATTNNNTKLKLSVMGNEMLNDVWFELADEVEDGFQYLTDEIEEDEKGQQDEDRKN